MGSQRKKNTPRPHLSLLLQSAMPWRNLLIITGCANQPNSGNSRCCWPRAAPSEGNCGQVATAVRPSGLRLLLWTLLLEHWHPELADPSTDGQNQPLLHNASQCRNSVPKFRVWSVLQPQPPIPPGVYQEGREQLVTKMRHRQPNYPNCGIWNRWGKRLYGTATLFWNQTNRSITRSPNYLG